MTDIIFVKRRDHVLVIADSTAGERWMQDNCIMAHPPTHTISKDTLEEFITNVVAAELTFEVR